MRITRLVSVVALTLSPAAARAEDETGEQIYKQLCSRCHGTAGEGTQKAPAPLVGGKSAAQLANVIDRTMPEEVNRIVTDRLADLLLTPSRDGDENLLAEGVPRERIHFVGNIMIDTLRRHLEVATFDRIRGRFPIDQKRYAVLTLHRPSNVDHRQTFVGILAALKEIAHDMPIVFPVHPRTRVRLGQFGLDASLDGLVLTEPLGYIDFLSLTSNARLILTDSGGLQEESTALGIPCLTMRENTERPATISEGTNRLVGTQTANILAGYREAMTGSKPARLPELWDGQTAGRITNVFRNYLLR